ncbi:MAG: regulatory protein RecX, partial [Acidimicrobiia bacterium]
MGVPSEVAEKVDARLVELGVLDDPTFAEIWVDHAQGRGVAVRAIKEGLKSKGVASETISQATAGLSEDVEMMRALELARRRIRTYGGLTKRKAFERLARFLLSKGYDQELVVEVCRRAFGEAPVGAEGAESH